MVALVDANNFYVSCERVFQPQYQKTPLVVLSNNDGCIVSRSNEVKAMGVGMAASYYKIRHELSKSGVVAFSSNYTLYADMSNRVTEILRNFTSEIEVYSIDESFLHFKKDTYEDYVQLGNTIQKKVLQSTGIPTGIGMGPTKTIAKIAANIAKKHSHLNGVCVISNIEQLEWALKQTAIEKVWGIGHNYAKLLRKRSVNTAYDFTNMQEYLVRKHMKVHGLRTQAELRGTPCIELDDLDLPKKMIATTRMFGKPQTEKKYIQEAVATYATRCAEKLRKQKSNAQIVSVFIYAKHNAHTPHFDKFQTTIALPIASNSQAEIVRLALRGLDRIFQPNIQYKKAGVIVSELSDASHTQGNLFVATQTEQHKKLSETTDNLNAKYGRDTLKLAIQGDGEKWKLRQENISSCFTTRMSDVLRVNAHKAK